MVNLFFVDPRAVRRVHDGPLGAYIDGFAAWLSERGYARQTAKVQIRLVAELSRWLRRQGLGVRNLDEQSVAKFLRHKRRYGRLHRGNAATLRTLLCRLRTAGVISAATPPNDSGSLHPIGKAFAQYLSQERGLSRATLLNYGVLVRRFLEDRFGTGPLKCEQVNPAEIARFLLRYARAYSLTRVKLMVTALRSFFRFLRLRGDLRSDLAGAVPTVAYWRLSTLPKSLQPHQVKRLLDSCDQATATGQRDYALLLLLARLGLRAGEVVGLTLEDIDWEAGELTVRGKNAQQDRLPLPRDVGAAVARYLRHVRPRCSTRRVFVRMQAPRQGFASSVAVCTIVRRAIERAGLRPTLKGAHLLRHSLATQMLRQGASLAQIGEILRHRTPKSTEIYAKVDLRALRALTQPWPRGAV